MKTNTEGNTDTFLCSTKKEKKNDFLIKEKEKHKNEYVFFTFCVTGTMIFFKYIYVNRNSLCTF